MKVFENQKYEFYGVLSSINETTADTFSTKFLLENKDEVIVRFPISTELELNEIYKISGIGHIYKAKTHIYAKEYIKLDDMDLTDDLKEQIRSKIFNYILVDYKTLKKYIENKISSLENETIKKITEYIYNERKEDFLVYPAAHRFHHAYKHGLLFHTYNTLRIAESLMNIYPNINSDLVISGVILHDIMKTIEIAESGQEYTQYGKLIGHISLGSQEIIKCATKLNLENEEEILLLNHIILSHHREGNFGSPKRPQIIEALIVHLSDSIDAKVEPTIEALSKTNINEFSEPIAVNDKDKFFKHKLSK